MAELGRGIDELQCDLLLCPAACLGHQRLTEGNHTCLGSTNGTLDDQKVLIDLTVVWEASHRCDSLLSEIVLTLCIVRIVTGSLAHPIDLLVNLGTVMVTMLTCTRDLELDTGRMPCANASNLSETTVCLAWQACASPTCDDTMETVTLGCTDDVNHFVVIEDGRDRKRLLKHLHDKVDLVSHRTTIDLDLLDVCFLLANLDLGHLGVADSADDLAILLGAVDLSLHWHGLILGGLSVTLGVLCEGLLLALVPILVEAALDLI